MVYAEIVLLVVVVFVVNLPASRSHVDVNLVLLLFDFEPINLGTGLVCHSQ